MSDKTVLLSDMFALLHSMGILTFKKEKKSNCFIPIHAPPPPTPPLFSNKKKRCKIHNFKLSI